MSRVLGLASLAVLFASSPAPAADDAKAVIAKAVKAHGGEEFLTKMKAAQMSNKGKIKLPGVGEVEFTQEATTMQPDKLKDLLELNINGQTVKVETLMSGDTISIEAMGQKVPVTDDIKKAMKDAQHMMEVGRLVSLLKDKGFELAIIGDVKVEDKPAVGVTVSKKGKKDINLYFDKETHLLAKIEHRTVEPGTGKEITEERFLMEYAKTDGIPLPKKVLLKHDGEKFLEAEVLSMKFMEKVDDAEFKK